MNIIKYILVILAILCFISLPVLIVLIKFQNTLPLGALLKSRLIRYPLLVSTINLNVPGDGRYVYLAPAVKTISVRISTDSTETLNNQTNLWITQMILETTGKSVDIQDTSLQINPQSAYTQTDLNRIHERLTHSSPSDPVLNIVYLKSFQDKPSYAGVTLHRDTIFIFKDTIAGLTQKTSEVNALEQSTLLHEWGHLLGMDHNDFPNCIMAGEVEVNDGSPFAKNTFPTQYCWNELYELKSLSR